MKKLFIALTMALTLTATASAQKVLHRHNPQIVNAADATDNDEVVAYSDTTSASQDSVVATTAAQTAVVPDDYNGFDKVSGPFDLIAYLTHLSSAGGVIVAVFTVLLCLLTVLSPIIMVILIIYFVMRNRNRRYKIIEKAVESGQQIPQELLRDSASGDERLWSKGVRNAAIGLGVIAFGFVLDVDFFVGAGFIMLFYGVGQAVVARYPVGGRRRDKERPFDDDNLDGGLDDIKD